MGAGRAERDFEWIRVGAGFGRARNMGLCLRPCRKDFPNAQSLANIFRETEETNVEDKMRVLLRALGEYLADYM